MTLLNDVDFLIDLNNKKEITQPEPLISNFIQKCRIMPPGTPFPGPVDLTLTPWVIEWMDNMSPYSTVQKQSIMKAAQVAATFAEECVIGFWMKVFPTAILQMSATDKLLEKWATKRLEPMIDSIGMRENIIEFAENYFGKKSRRTGDKTYSKLFIGGFLEMASAQSPASQRSDSIRLLVRDEIDGAPAQLTTGEGNWLKVSEARTKFWGDRKKIMDLSTPTLFDTSAIYQGFLEGDQRLFMVPCPMCGKTQSLFWEPEQEKYGLKVDTTAGKIERVYYQCEHCYDAIFESSKYEMLNLGKWEPQTKWSDIHRSYDINSLYSPSGTVSWLDYYTEWLNARDDPEKMRGFTNLWGGQPYRETGSRPKIEKVIEFRGSYKSGQVPNEVLWITAGADVQRGKKIYEQYSESDFEKELCKLTEQGLDLWKCDLPRIELEVLGHSHGYRTYSVEYKIFFGSTLDPYSGSWEKLRQWMEDTGLIYSRLEGSKIACNLVFVDSGDGERMTQVYNFCEQYPGVFPIKGDQVLKKKKDEKGDELMASAYKRYSVSKIGESQFLYTIATNHYKSKIYASLRKNRIAGEEQAPGFPEFPRDYPDYYFQMLTAEERHIDGSFHAGGRRNEALDCRVYALCAGDVWLDNQVNHYREILVKKGMPRDQAKKVYTWKTQIEKMKFQRWAEMGKTMQGGSK